MEACGAQKTLSNSATSMDVSESNFHILRCAKYFAGITPIYVEGALWIPIKQEIEMLVFCVTNGIVVVKNSFMSFYVMLYPVN